MMEEDLRALLLANAGVAAAVGTRVHWAERPQGSKLPAVTLYRVGGREDYHMEAPSGLEESMVQVDCWGQTYTDALSVARAVGAAVTGFRGVVGATDFQGIFVVSKRDAQPDPQGPAASRAFRTMLDIVIWHGR